MKKGLELTLAVVTVLLLLSSLARAESLDGKFGLGLNYPGVCLKYGLSSKLAIETRGQFGGDISAYGGRGYYYFNPENEGNFAYFSGVEANLISFKADASEGGGYCAVAFLGGEYFISRRLSLQMDFGPVYVSLTDDDTDEIESGLDYVVNLGLNLYLGGKGGAE